MMSIDFQPYLRSIATTYEKWWQYYTPTDAEGKQRQKQASAPIFDFGLMVQTVPKQEREQPQQEKEKVERFSVLEGLRKYALREKPEPVLLVGRPGSGKSTALARLMLGEAALTLNPSPDGRGILQERIPVLVELRYWQGSIDQLILNALHHHELAVSHEQLETVVAQSLLLFDGVNELPSEEARSQLIAFHRSHAKIPMIFTTRDLSLGGDLGIERKLEMQPLTNLQMQAFIRAYIPEQAEAMLRQLKERLREFGQTPLLLWMLCEVFKQSPTQQLPNNLGGIFQVFTRTYEDSSVRKHEVAALKGDVKPLTDRRLWKKALMAIASIMMQGETPVDFREAIHRDEAERELSRVFPNEKFPVRDILDDLLKYHLLQNKTTDQIEFRHQLIQEYYAAEYLLRLLQPTDEKPELTDDQLKQDYLNYLKWTEPITLMLALVESEAQALRVVQQAMDVDLILGTRLSGEVKREFQVKTVCLETWNFNMKLLTKNLPLLKVEFLARTRSEAAITQLLYFLQYEIPSVRQKAIYALGEIGSTKSVPALINALRDENLEIRESTIYALGKIRTDQSIAALVEELQNESSDTCGTAAEVFGEICCEEAVPVLLKAWLNQRWQESRQLWGIFEALGKINSDLATLSLITALKSEDEVIRCLATRGLSETCPDAAIPALIQALKDDCAEVRMYAAIALRKSNSDLAIPELIDALTANHNSSLWARVEVARTLGAMRSRQAVPRLINVLAAKDEEVCGLAAEVLGEIVSEQAVPPLINVMENRNTEARWAAASALCKTGSVEAIKILIKYLRFKDVNSRRMAASALGEMKLEQGITALINALKDEDIEVRWRATYSIGKTGSEKAIKSLVNALETDHDEVRSRAASALGKIGSNQAVESLLNALKDEDIEVRWRATESLGKIGSKQAVRGLLKALEDEEPEVRWNAAEALGSIRCTQATSGLVKALRDKNGTVRRYAAQALGRLGNPISLADLWRKLLEDPEAWHLEKEIATIQTRCQFYNYEIFQAYLAAQKGVQQNSQSSDRPPTTIYNIDQVGILNTGSVSIHGDQIGRENS